MGDFFVLAHGFQPFLEGRDREGSGGNMGLARSSSGVWMEFEPQDEEEDRPCSRGGTGCSVETVMRERETAARRREVLRTGCGRAEGLGGCLAAESCLSLSERLEARTEAIRRIIEMVGREVLVQRGASKESESHNRSEVTCGWHSDCWASQVSATSTGRRWLAADNVCSGDERGKRRIGARRGKI